MEAGISVLNDKNTVQIDGNYRNMLLIASGQFTASQANTNADLWFNSLLPVWSRATSAVMLVVRHPGPWGMALSIGSTRNGVKVCNFNFKRHTSVTFQYYIYDLVAPSPSATFGMEVFDATGKLSYSSADYPLRVVAKTNGTNYVGAHEELAYGCTGGGYFVSVDWTDVEEDIAYSYWSGNTLVFRYDHVVNEYPGGATEGNWGNNNQHGVIVDTRNVPKNFRRDA